MPTISVIVPVHNVEDYLEQCLRSLITQNYCDIEILLVDDGSTDRSSNICDSYAAKDNRVKVFHTINRGVSAARNTGIENAKGDFLMFVDGDDWVEPDFCSKPLEIALLEEADVVIFGFYRERMEKEDYRNTIHKGEISFQDRFTLFEELSLSYAWNKICKRKVYFDVRFPEGFFYEDIPVAYKVLENSKKAWYLDDKLYHYRKRIGSITSTKTHEKENDQYETKMMAVNDLLSWGMKDIAEVLRCKTNFIYILRMDRRGKHTRECIDYFRSREYRKDVLSWKARLMVRAFLWLPILFVAVSACYGYRASD